VLDPVYDDAVLITPVYPDAYGQYPGEPWRRPDSEIYYDNSGRQTPPDVYDSLRNPQYDWDSGAEGLGRRSERSYRSNDDEIRRQPRNWPTTDL